MDIELGEFKKDFERIARERNQSLGQFLSELLPNHLGLVAKKTRIKFGKDRTHSKGTIQSPIPACLKTFLPRQYLFVPNAHEIVVKMIKKGNAVLNVASGSDDFRFEQQEPRTFLSTLSGKASIVYALDIDQEVIRRLKELEPHYPNIRAILGDARNLRNTTIPPTLLFDTSVCIQGLGWIYSGFRMYAASYGNPGLEGVKKAVKEMVRITKQKGTIVIIEKGQREILRHFVLSLIPFDMISVPLKIVPVEFVIDTLKSAGIKKIKLVDLDTYWALIAKK